MAKRLKRRMPSSKRSAPVFRFISLGTVNTFKGRFLKIIKKTKSFFQRGIIVIEKKPLTSFFTLLILLFVLIIVGSIFRQPKVEDKAQVQPKQVRVYSVGKAPRVQFAAQIEKTGVIKIVAQTPGIVQEILVTEGQEVEQGTTLVSLSSNYSGGNAASIQRQIAQATYSNIKDTYQIQKDLIQKQRDLSDRNDTNSDRLRDITSKSIDETKSLLSLNQGIVDTLNQNLSDLENNPPSPANDASILQTKQLISQFQSGINQLQSGLRGAEYSSGNDNPPAQLSDISRELTQKQLDIQSRALELSIEASRLQLQLAQVQEATMYPSAPFKGVIERVYVTPGESVNPGTPLLLIHGAQTLKVVARVPAKIARNTSYIEASKIQIGSETFEAVPSYISTEATDGNLYSVLFSLPEEYQNKLTDREFVQIELPVGLPNTTTAVPFVPLDAIYQSETSAYLFVAKNGKAESKKVILGSILGEYVEVLQGLSSGDSIILDRNVVSDDLISEI